jgi:hypothetical protein
MEAYVLVFPHDFTCIVTNRMMEGRWGKTNGISID